MMLIIKVPQVAACHRHLQLQMLVEAALKRALSRTLWKATCWREGTCLRPWRGDNSFWKQENVSDSFFYSSQFELDLWCWMNYWTNVFFCCRVLCISVVDNHNEWIHFISCVLAPISYLLRRASGLCTIRKEPQGRVNSQRLYDQSALSGPAEARSSPRCVQQKRQGFAAGITSGRLFEGLGGSFVATH